MSWGGLTAPRSRSPPIFSPPGQPHAALLPAASRFIAIYGKPAVFPPLVVRIEEMTPTDKFFANLRGSIFDKGEVRFG